MKTQVWVLMLKDRKGKPIGFHKVSGDRFYHTLEDAQEQLRVFPSVYKGYTVVEAVIDFAEALK